MSFHFEVMREIYGGLGKETNKIYVSWVRRRTDEVCEHMSHGVGKFDVTRSYDIEQKTYVDVRSPRKS